MSIYRRVLQLLTGPFSGRPSSGLVLSLCGIALNLLKPWPLKIIVDNLIPFVKSGGGAQVDARFERLIYANPMRGLALLCLALVAIQLLWGSMNLVSNYLFVKTGLAGAAQVADRPLRLPAVALAQVSRRAPFERFELSRRLRFAVDPDDVQPRIHQHLWISHHSHRHLRGHGPNRLAIDAALTRRRPADRRGDLLFRASHSQPVHAHPRAGQRASRANSGRLELGAHGARFRPRRMGSPPVP